MGTKLKVVKIKCKCDHRWKKTTHYSSVLALSGAFSCLKRSLGAKTRVRPKSNKRSSKLQFQEHWRLLLCSSLLAVRASVSAWCLLSLCLFLCVNVSLLRLMPQTAPALSFIDAHHSLSLLPVFPVPPTPLLPSLSWFLRPSAQSPHQNKHEERISGWWVSRFLGGGVDTEGGIEESR